MGLCLSLTHLLNLLGFILLDHTLRAPGSRHGSSAKVNWSKLAQHRKAGELSRKVLTDPFWIWPGRKLWGQKHEPGSREKQAELSFILSGSVRRLVLLYRMPNFASAHTDTWKTGTRFGAGLAGVGVAAPCRPIAALQSQPLKVQTFHQDYWTPTRDFSPFPLPYSCFFPLGQTPPLCCRGSSPPFRFNLLHHWCFPRAAVPSPGAFGRRKQSTLERGGSPGCEPWGTVGWLLVPAFASLCSACFPKENSEIFQTFQRD